VEVDECQKRTILTDSSKIIEAVETVRDGSFQPQLGEGNHQPLVPTEAAARQDYEKLMAIIDKIPLNDIVNGLSFHQQLVQVQDVTSTPYSLEVFDQIREAMLHRSEVLGEAAESAGAVVSEESASILRVKAKDHLAKVEMFDDLLRYAEMLEGAQKTLDELDERLGEAMLHNAEDECEKWLMDSPTSASTNSAQESGGGETGFTAADIALGVVLNKLSLIGLSYMFWSREKRKYIRKFFSQIKQRPAFVRGVDAVGRLDSPPFDIKKSGSDVEDGHHRIPSEQSIEVLNVLLRAPPYYKDLNDRTWHDLW